jgi:Uma2 family endonuclease
MDPLNLDLNKRYSYADYLTWMDDARRELHDGFVKLMTPAPSSKHQAISFNLTRLFGNFIFKKQCRGFAAPSDVRFPINKDSKSDKQVYTVLQPDLCVVCDLTKIDERGCLGAPDLVIEIISPINPERDTKDKFEIYQQNGVREYWILNPDDENVTVFVLNDKSKFQFVGMYAGDGRIPVNIFNGDLQIDLTEVFVP